MSELSFLVELLLHHKLQKPTKELIAQRIEELSQQAPRPAQNVGSYQAPSTLKAMERHTNPAANKEADVVAQVPQQIAQTPATAAAMAERQRAIDEALSGKMNKERGHARKF